MTDREHLGVGIIGAGFIADFHAKSWMSVRDADLVAVTSRSADSARRLKDTIEQRRVGTAVALHASAADLARDPRVDAIWMLAPNYAKVEVVREICDEVRAGRANLRGIAIEKPLGRTLAEARAILELVEGAGLKHGYLENQVFSPGIVRPHELLWARGAAAAGNPYLARCAEEHSGPHKAWFWDGQEQGGGVLNDMMCHSLEAGRYLLTPPGTNLGDWLTPRRVSASIDVLKWNRARYAEELLATYPGAPDYRQRPSEDYARASVEFTNGDGETVVLEATTSWSYVGAGLRHNFELLGPEYSMMTNTLSTEAQVFFSRRLQQDATEDMIEKQNAEQGLIPVLSDDASSYGYIRENQQFTADFLAGVQPRESLRNGVEIVELMMACYLAAEQRTTVELPTDLSEFVPQVAAGTWRP